jgi:hypothetical protein
MKSSDGRHGGNQGRTDRGEAENARRQAARNTDVDSRRGARERDRSEGHTSGRR